MSEAQTRPAQVDALYDILEKYSKDADGTFLAGDRIRCLIVTEILGVFPCAQPGWDAVPALEKAYERGRIDEREACAKVCDGVKSERLGQIGEVHTWTHYDWEAAGARKCAELIRAMPRHGAAQSSPGCREVAK